jgi:hypothetical protein
MFKRNPDAIALVLIAGSILLSGAVARARTAELRRPMVASLIAERHEFKTQVHHTVASLKQCLHLRSHRNPIARVL